MWKTLGISGSLLILSHFDVWAGNSEGLAAFQRGDYTTASQEFAVAAARGDSDAMLNLSMMYAEQCGVEASGWEAEGLFDEAVQANNAVARFLLMEEVLWGGRGDAKELSKVEVVSLPREAAIQGFPLAMFTLAVQYERAAPADLVRAHAWLSLFAARTAHAVNGDSAGSAGRPPQRQAGGATELVQASEELAAKLSPDQLRSSREIAEQLDKEIPRSELPSVFRPPRERGHAATACSC